MFNTHLDNLERFFFPFGIPPEKKLEEKFHGNWDATNEMTGMIKNLIYAEVNERLIMSYVS